MNVEKPNTLEQQDHAPNYGLAGPSSTGRPRRRWWLWLTLVVLLGLVLYHFRPQANETKAAADSAGAGGRAGRGPMVIPVVAARAHKGDIGVYLTGLGAVTPIYTVTVRSRVDGQLMQVHYKEGDSVRAGDPLVEIDPRPYQVQLEQAEGQLAKDQAALDNARVDLARYQTLVPKNAVPEQQLATQQATVRQYEAAVKIDQGQIDSAKLNLVYCHITAPISGRIGLRLVDPGNIVHASDTNGLLVITQIRPISVIFTIAEDQLPAVLQKVRAGQRLLVNAYDRNMTTKLATGWLTTIDNQIDPTTGTVKLRANFENQDGALFPNQFVNARLLVEEKHGVTIVPTAAVQRNSQTTYVYLVKPDSTVTVRPVTIGTVEDDNSQITSGVAPGDVVVMTGVDKLQEGSRVRAEMYGERSQKES
jgi:multidrug efflux system membrane fusion protein